MEGHELQCWTDKVLANILAYPYFFFFFLFGKGGGERRKCGFISFQGKGLFYFHPLLFFSG